MMQCELNQMLRSVAEDVSLSEAFLLQGKNCIESSVFNVFNVFKGFLFNTFSAVLRSINGIVETWHGWTIPIKEAACSIWKFLP